MAHRWDGDRWRTGREDEDDYKRRHSGFWEHEHRIDVGESVWRCDLMRLEEVIRRIMHDPMEAQQFSSSPKTYLDMRFGRGTADAYFNHRRDRGVPYVDMRTNRFGRFDAGYVEGSRPNYQHAKPKPKRQPKLVKTLPLGEITWLNQTSSLLPTLQSEFDHWASRQMALVRSWTTEASSENLQLSKT